jgi:putative SOS response-associated peptidase YedK
MTRRPTTSRRPTGAFVTAGENGVQRLREGRWWLVPWWAKEMPPASRHLGRLQGHIRLDALPDPGGRLLRMGEVAGRRRRDSVAHLPAWAAAVFLRWAWAYNKNLDGRGDRAGRQRLLYA